MSDANFSMLVLRTERNIVPNSELGIVINNEVRLTNDESMIKFQPAVPKYNVKIAVIFFPYNFKL